MSRRVKIIKIAFRRYCDILVSKTNVISKSNILRNVYTEFQQI